MLGGANTYFKMVYHLPSTQFSPPRGGVFYVIGATVLCSNGWGKYGKKIARDHKGLIIKEHSEETAFGRGCKHLFPGSQKKPTCIETK